MAKIEDKEELNSLDFFVSGVPPGPLFKMSFDDLKKMVDSSTEIPSLSNSVAEVCLIALVAYLEAFFKNEFAALVNIYPQLLKLFCTKRTDTSVSIKDLLTTGLDMNNKLGFLLSEKYDFGSAKTVNSLYFDLLSVTVFSKDECKTYERLSNDRNLLVHHAGIYTMRYHEQAFSRQKVDNRIFYDSLRVLKKDYYKWASFGREIVGKTIDVCYRQVVNDMTRDGVKPTKVLREAVNYLNWFEQ